jgi:hypothetical protein
LLYLSKIGDIPIRIHREIEREIKQIIIKKHGFKKGRTQETVKTEGKTFQNL